MFYNTLTYIHRGVKLFYLDLLLKLLFFCPDVPYTFINRILINFINVVADANIYICFFNITLKTYN